MRSQHYGEAMELDGLARGGSPAPTLSLRLVTVSICTAMVDGLPTIEVIPGCNDSQRPYDSTVATSFRSVKGWTEKQMRNYDYGDIILPTEGALGAIVGSFGIINSSGPELTTLKVNLSGYPSDKPRGTQWFHARGLDSITDRFLVYSIDTGGGQSGSPVWRLSNGERLVVGIHTNGDISGNSATRIVAPVFDNIVRWRDEAS